MENKMNCILLVDDDIATNFINKKIIQKANIVENVQVVSNGKEAIEYLCNRGKFESNNNTPKPELILLDINMPVMDGYEATRKIRAMADQAKAGVYIIALTASVSNSTYSKIKEIGIDDYLHKPFNPDVLKNKLEQLFEDRVNA